nr:MAG TPA: vesicle-associated membrane protein 2 [Caudoviricetes sp.]
MWVLAEGDSGKIYDRLDEHDRRITVLESTRPFLQELTERSIKSYDALSKTMQDVQLSMVKMNDKMDTQAESLRNLQDNMSAGNKAMSEKITVIENRVANIDEEGKFNIRTWFKTNWPWVLIVMGLGIMVASQYVKF